MGGAGRAGAGAKGGGAAHAHDDEGDDALADAVVVDFPDLPLAYPEEGVGLCAPLGFFGEAGQEWQGLLVEFL